MLEVDLRTWYMDRNFEEEEEEDEEDMMVLLCARKRLMLFRHNTDL